MQPHIMMRIALLAIACVTGSVAAETALQPPPMIPYGPPISIETAKVAAAATVTEAHSHGWAMAIAIVDPAGLLVYFEKMRDAQNASGELAMEKARTSALSQPISVTRYKSEISVGVTGVKPQVSILVSGHEERTWQRFRRGST